MNISLFLALALNLTPAFSISAIFSNIFVQPRYFWLGAILFFGLPKFTISPLTKVGIKLALLSLFVPLIGFFFERKFSLLDLAMFINWVYLIFFSSIVLKNKKRFDRFLQIFLWMNILYSVFQVFVVNLGYPELAMIHSNVPYQQSISYEIIPMYFSWLPRYSGLFVESGPLTLFLIFSFLYINYFKAIFTAGLRYGVLILILFSQSKFLLVFIPLYILELGMMRFFARTYRMVTSRLGILISFISAATLLFFVFRFTKLDSFLQVWLVAYELRMRDLIDGFHRVFTEKNLFGTFLQGSNYDASGGVLPMPGLDIFSILFTGYGFFFGSVIVFVIFHFIILCRLPFKFTFIFTLAAAFMAAGSLLVPHYSFLLIFCYLIHVDFRSKGLLCRTVCVIPNRKGTGPIQA